MTLEDTHDLERFVEAQQPVIDRVRAELRRGRKTTHWMWFVFPQISGLGRSDMARRYAIASLDEARSYVHHPVLGPHLEECTRLVLAIEGRDIRDILGHPDDLKFQSSMTLFAHATPDDEIFIAALQKYFGGAFDSRTLEVLGAALSATDTHDLDGRMIVPSNDAHGERV